MIDHFYFLENFFFSNSTAFDIDANIKAEFILHYFCNFFFKLLGIFYFLRHDEWCEMSWAQFDICIKFKQRISAVHKFFYFISPSLYSFRWSPQKSSGNGLYDFIFHLFLEFAGIWTKKNGSHTPPLPTPFPDPVDPLEKIFLQIIYSSSSCSALSSVITSFLYFITRLTFLSP